MVGHAPFRFKRGRSTRSSHHDDLVLAGDNAIVIGLAAAGLPLQQRTKAVLVGIIAATVLRMAFAAATTQLLQVVGLVLAGGILLLWVSWKVS
jgi:predicted tellurium resistance membrane protein TerC